MTQFVLVVSDGIVHFGTEVSGDEVKRTWIEICLNYGAIAVSPYHAHSDEENVDIYLVSDTNT